MLILLRLLHSKFSLGRLSEVSSQWSLMKMKGLLNHFHNDVNSFEILPWTSLASISCGSKSQKCALILAKHDLVLYVSSQHNDMI